LRQLLATLGQDALSHPEVRQAFAELPVTPAASQLLKESFEASGATTGSPHRVPPGALDAGRGPSTAPGAVPPGALDAGRGPGAAPGGIPPGALDAGRGPGKK